jgi:hypothetical protein
MSTQVDRIVAAKLLVLVDHGFSFDPRRLVFVSATCSAKTCRRSIKPKALSGSSIWKSLHALVHLRQWGLLNEFACYYSRVTPESEYIISAARAAIPIEDVEDHDLEWLEKWIAETETVPRTS